MLCIILENILDTLKVPFLPLPRVIGTNDVGGMRVVVFSPTVAFFPFVLGFSTLLRKCRPWVNFSSVIYFAESPRWELKMSFIVHTNLMNILEYLTI